MDPEEEESIKKMDELSLEIKNDGASNKSKPLSAYAGNRANRKQKIANNQSRGKMECQSQIPNELLEAANVANGLGENNENLDGDNKTDCISLDDITNEDNDLDDIVVTQDDLDQSPERNMDRIEV